MIKKLTKDIKRSIGCFLGIVLGTILTVSFVFLPDTVKWIGAPFLLLPDAFGLVERVHPDEAIRLVAKPAETVTFNLEEPGAYFVFHSTYYKWLTGPKHTIMGPQGFVPQENLGTHVYPYHTTLVSGQPAFRIQITEPGRYTLTMNKSGPETLTTRYHLGIVPDYVTGNEKTLAWAYYLQVVFLIMLGWSYYYFRILRPGLIGHRQRTNVQLQKRDEIDGFLDNLKQETAKQNKQRL